MNAWMLIVPAALILCFGIIYFARLPRKLWELCAAFLVLGLAGYALQGSPQLAASPGKPVEQDAAAADALITIRAEMAATFAHAKNWTILADSLARKGNYSLAMAVTESGLKKWPKSADLWAAQGLYAMLANNGQIGPPSEFAFAKARENNPRLAAPDYFEGLNALANGELIETFEKWNAALENAPKDSKWGPKVRQQLNSLTASVRAALEETADDQPSE